MRKLLLSVAVLVLAGAPVRAQEAEAVLDKAIKAQGDEKTAKSLQTAVAKAKGSVSIQGMKLDFSIETWVQLPDKTKNVIVISAGGMNIEITEVFTGKKGWASIMGESKDLDDDEIKELKDKMHGEAVTNLLPIKEDKEMKVTSLGASKVGEKDVVGILVSKKDQRDVKLFFDKATYLLLKTESQTRHPVTKQEAKADAYYSEYKELVPGVKIAVKVVINYDGEKFMEYEMTEIRAVPMHEDSVFARPKQ